MTKYTITLTDPVYAYIDDRLAEGRHASLSDYLSDLVMQDMAQRTNAKEELRGLLDSAEQSGISPHGLDAILDAARVRKAKAGG